MLSATTFIEMSARTRGINENCHTEIGSIEQITEI